jgi:hypothetical protein
MVTKDFQQGLSLVKWNLQSGDLKTVKICENTEATKIDLCLTDKLLWFYVDGCISTVSVKSLKTQNKLNLKEVIENYESVNGIQLEIAGNVQMDTSIFPEIAILYYGNVFLTLYLPSAEIIRC